MIFHYAAMDSSGRETDGLIEAESPDAAVASLRAKGLCPTHMREATDAEIASGTVVKASSSAEEVLPEDAGVVLEASSGRVTLRVGAETHTGYLSLVAAPGDVPPAIVLYAKKPRILPGLPAIWRAELDTIAAFTPADMVFRRATIRLKDGTEVLVKGSLGRLGRLLAFELRHHEGAEVPEFEPPPGLIAATGRALLGRHWAWFVAVPVLAGLITFTVGLPLYFSTVFWIRHASSANWPQVPARIESVEPEFVEGSSGPMRGVTCRYTYEYEGRRYTGHRLRIRRSDAHRRHLHRSRYENLRRQMDAGEPITAFVDPDNPAYAILFRDEVSFGIETALVGTAFAGVWIALAVYALAGLKREARRRPGDHPWLARGDWRMFRSRASAGDLLLRWVVLVVFLAGWFYMLAPAVFHGDDYRFPTRVFAFVLMAVYVLLLCETAYGTLQRLANGPSEIVFDELPVVPGRRATCVLRTLRTRLDPDSVEAAVTVASRGVIGAGGFSGLKIDAEVDLPKASEDGAGTLVPLAFVLPAHSPVTTKGVNKWVSWKLKTTARGGALPFEAEFDLPVFRAGESEIRGREEPPA